jgi:intein/homing endonuclease
MSKYSKKINADDAKEVMVESKGKTRALSDIIETAYLHLGDLSVRRVHDYIVTPPEQFADNPIFEFLYYLSDPKYVYFCAKYLYNMTLLPMQVVALQTLWKHKFPMLVCSRGWGKCVCKSTKILTEHGIQSIGDVVGNISEKSPKYINGKLLGENGWNDIDYVWNNGVEETVKIKTNYGYILEGNKVHPIRVVEDDKIVWKELKDIRLNDNVLIHRNYDDYWDDNNPLNITPDVAYFFGALIGDGGYTIRGTIRFTTADLEILERMNRAAGHLWGKVFKKIPGDNYDYGFHGVKYWDELFIKYGFNSPVCKLKDIPKCISLCRNKQIIKNFLSGLFDTDGTVGHGNVSYTSRSRNLVYSIQRLLLMFGIIGRVYRQYNKKYRRYYHTISFSGMASRIFEKEVGFFVSRKVLRLQKLNSRSSNENIDTIPSSLIVFRLEQLKQYVKGIMTVRSSKYPSRWSLQHYRPSYAKLRKILDIFADYKDDPAYKELLEIYDNWAFFDVVKSIKSDRHQTFDVHLKGDDHSFITNGFVSHNTSMLGLYSLMRATFEQGTKVIYVGSNFRQSKLLFSAAEQIYRRAPIFRHMVGGDQFQGPKGGTSEQIFYVGESQLMAIPTGTGEKIRGLRSNITIADEFSALPISIFEVVIKGFASVSSSPIEKVQRAAAKEYMESQGIDMTTFEEMLSLGMGNQTVISGTASFHFNHFYKYWKRYKEIIETHGDEKKLQNIFGGIIPEDFNYRDYAIIRIPYDSMPRGFMDSVQISQSKAMQHSSLFLLENCACFISDSDGFFRRSIVEKCVTNNPILLPSGPVQFEAATQGHKDCKYVYGIDPASENDNFAIIVLEVHPDHRRIVYCWTVTRKKMQERLKNNTVEDKSFYNYCARKIRDLMRVFPTQHIGMDAQGGGRTGIAEALHDTTQLEQGEKLIWQYVKEGDQDPYFWEEKGKPTDGQAGEHILHLVEFANAKFTSEANHGLKRDLETKTLLFPRFDAASIGLAFEADKIAGREYDTLEDVVIEIEELKDELATVEHTQTANGRDRWDTPDTVKVGFKKARMRKDRYSALCIANMIARVAENALEPTQYNVVGGYVGQKKSDVGGALYVGPQYITQKIGSFYGMGVHR